MSSRVGVFVDVGNLFYCIGKKWPSRKIDYRKFLEQAANSKEVSRAFAFGTQVEDSATKFISCLHHIGFVTHYREIERGQWYNWAAGMSVELVRHHRKLDEIVIGSSDMTMAPVVRWLRENGTIVTVMGCGIPKELREASDHYKEIPEDMLEERDDSSEAA